MKNKFSKEIFADSDAYKMSCPEIVSTYLASKLSKYKSAIELCCAVGMTVIQLAKNIDRVTGIDFNKERIENAVNNSVLYSVSEKTHFIYGNVLDENLLKKQSAEIAILDPDWSFAGLDKRSHVFDLTDTQPNLRTLFNLSKKYITSNIVIRIPKTFTLETIAEFGPCKLENVFLDQKLKFKFAYFLENVKYNSEKDIFF